MSSTETILRDGIKGVISSFSPPSRSEEAADFKSSSHYFREACFCLEGTNRYMLNGSVYDCSPGNIILIDRWEEHAFGYLPEDCDLLHLWIYVDEEHGMRASLVRVETGGMYHYEFHKLQLTNGYMEILNDRWDMLLSAKMTCSQDAVLKYMSGPVNAILDEVATQLHRDDHSARAKFDSVIESLKQHILSCNGRDCSLRNLEKFSGYNRFYLSHRFRKSEGYTIGEYIDRIRISYTKRALRHGYRQKEIASELGFSCPANFWIWLRKHRKEISPTEING